MKEAKAKVFAPHKVVVAAQAGVRVVSLEPVLKFLTEVGPKNVISVCMIPPQTVVWYWTFTIGPMQIVDKRVTGEEKQGE